VHLHQHEGCGCAASSGSSAALLGPPRCIFIAVDYVLDVIYDYIARLAHMVFIKLFEFFAVSFELCRRVIWIIRLCARSSGFTSCDRTAQNNFVLSPKPVHMAIKQ
jgi:hypothetical protein